MKKELGMKEAKAVTIVIALVGGVSCATHTLKTTEKNPPTEAGSTLKGVTFNIEGVNVESVDFHDRGSYTNQAFQDADFIGGRIIE